MENFVVSARKYRPATFNTVVGQSSITATLKKAIENNHIAQAYLFCGPRGVGKTTIARIFAKTINCSNLSETLEPCNACDSCTAFNHHRSTNIHELDAASNNTVDNIRSLIEQVRIPPQVGKYSVYIIDEVHMLSASAFNAFLKTLEEPPAHAIFILATTEKHKILPTILSRCQIFDFNRIKVDEMVGYLEDISSKEGVGYEKNALTVIAQKADGAMRDALSIYDQVVSFSENHITYQQVIENLNVLDYDYYFRLTDAFMGKNHAEGLLIFNEILEKGFDGHQFINGLSKHLRDLLVCKDHVTLDLLEVGAGIREKYKIQSSKASMDFLIRALNLLNQYDVSYRTSMNQRLHIELAMIDLCNLEQAKKKERNNTQPSDKPERKDSQVVHKSEKTKKDLLVTTQQNHSDHSNKIEEPRSFSINNALKHEKETHNESPAEESEIHPSAGGDEKKATQAFSQEDLEKSWQEFASQYKHKPRLFNMLVANTPDIRANHTIHFKVENDLQKNQLHNMANELLIHLRRDLQNNLIELRTELLEDEQTGNKKLYTEEEKYNYLENKNKNLRKLKQDFDLDFD